MRAVDYYTMTDGELHVGVLALFGGRDQGQRDDLLKDKVSNVLHMNPEQAIRVLTVVVRSLLDPPHTIEDVRSFISFLDYYLDWA